MKIQCDCGKFEAELMTFPSETPGRLKCYCDDCQTYLHHIGRSDLLDTNGGTEIIPAYPNNIKILQGTDVLKCVRIVENGMYRFYTSCCNTPVGNTRPNSPWVGLLRVMYIKSNALDQNFVSVRSSIMGRYAKGIPPKGTPKTFDLRAFAVVMPFIIKGKLLNKFGRSPFFKEDGRTPVVGPHVLSASEYQAARKLAGF